MNIESLDIELTTKCNLSCKYCYIGMEKLKDNSLQFDMSDETIQDALDLIEKFGHPRPYELEHPNGKRQKKQATIIAFYGGEPLLSFNQVKYFIEESKKRGMKLKFSLLSNGTTGTKEQFDYLKENKCWIQRSIDGHPEAQETYRENSIKKYEEVSKVYRDYDQTRRMTINPEFAKDIMKSVYYFEETGFQKGISPMPNFYAEWKDEHIEDFKKSLWALGRHVVERKKKGDNFYVFWFKEELEGRKGKRKFGCGGGRGLHCVSADGYLYVCHRFSKESKDGDFCYGSVKDIIRDKAKGYGPSITDHAEKSKQPNNESAWREDCRYCIAKHSCDKGCMNVGYKCTGDVNIQPKLYCAIKRESVRVVDWIQWQLNQMAPKGQKGQNVKSNPRENSGVCICGKHTDKPERQGCK